MDKKPRIFIAYHLLRLNWELSSLTNIVFVSGKTIEFIFSLKTAIDNVVALESPAMAK